VKQYEAVIVGECVILGTKRLDHERLTVEELVP
jgi:hypothetical protein